MKLWDFIYDHLEERQSVFLIVVIDTEGSSPGRVGFKMAIAEGGDFIGSIGGGIMEFNMVETARRMFKDNQYEVVVRRQVHTPESEHDKSGMICSGEQTQAFIPLSTADLETFTQLRQSINNGEKGLITISNGGLHFERGASQEKQIISTFSDRDIWSYSEQIGLADTVYIFGAGHISLPLSQILRMLNFRVAVFDDRTDLSTFNANTFAHKKEIIDYKNASIWVPEGNNSYVAIMTFGHRSDGTVLRQMLPKKLRYLGMIGSKSKVGTLFDNLRQEGFSDESLSFVNSPIGLISGNQTPEEIAVSIAAKIIQIRNS
jgi:xanthine dehydrogenase accessory factor